MVPLHTLVQITDPHLVADGLLSRDGTDTHALLARALAVVEESGVAPSALLLTGDLAEHGDAATYRRVRALVEPVASRLGAQALYVVGNHDHRANLREHLLGLAPDDAPFDHVTRLGGLRVIVLDTSVPGHRHGELTPGQLTWLAAQLAEPAPDGTLVALHHPPLPNASAVVAAIELRDRAALGDVLRGSDVRLVVAGHTHLVAAGAIAGVPVWTAGATSALWNALPPAGRLQTLQAPTVSRIDVFADAVTATALPLDAPVVRSR